MKKQIADYIRSQSDEALISLALGSGMIIDARRQPPVASGSSNGRTPRVSTSSINSDELVLKTAGEFGKGFSTSELADKTGLSPTQARASLKRLMADEKLFTAGKLRFARYATTKDEAERASDEAAGK